MDTAAAAQARKKHWPVQTAGRPISEPLEPWPHLELPRPRAAVLAIDVQVVLRDLVGEEHAVVAALACPRVVRRADAAVDDEVRDMDVFRRELARHALREAAERELAHRERRRVRI